MNSSADHISFGCDIIREGSATKTTFQLDDPDSDTRLAAMESERDASVRSFDVAKLPIVAFSFSADRRAFNEGIFSLFPPQSLVGLSRK